MKRCARCGESKPTAEFPPDKWKRDGLCSYCRPCKREVGRETTRRRREQIREWEREHMTPCVDCGAPVHGWRGTHPSQRCPSCSSRELRNRYHRKYDPAYQQIVEWWSEGLTIREIAERRGSTPGATGVLIHKLRGRGYDLPYRTKPAQRAAA